MRAQIRSFNGLEFWLVGSPELRRTPDGNLYEYSHIVHLEQRLNAYEAGPFCQFGLAAAPSAPGVYAILVDDELKYIGRCKDLIERFSARGYGKINPRNVHDDGQSTNCKLNSKILAAAKSDRIVHVWFHSTNEFVSVEAMLIQTLAPQWNGRLHVTEAKRLGNLARNDEAAKLKITSLSISEAATPKKQDFDRELCRIFEDATLQGLERIEVAAARLHKIVEFYPRHNHRMPLCCARMRAAMAGLDRITNAPPKGNGARLTIEYLLPRK